MPKQYEIHVPLVLNIQLPDDDGDDDASDYQQVPYGYTAIPDNTLQCKEFESLEPTELKVYFCLYSRWKRGSNDGNTVKMSLEFIIEHTKLSSTTVRKSLKGLRQKDFINYVAIRNTVTTFTLNPKYTTDIRLDVDKW